MDEELRKAIEKSVRDGLAVGGTWTATLSSGKEVTFRPRGEFSVLIYDENGNEKNYKFQVVVELVL